MSTCNPRRRWSAWTAHRPTSGMTAPIARGGLQTDAIITVVTGIERATGGDADPSRWCPNCNFLTEEYGRGAVGEFQYYTEVDVVKPCTTAGYPWDVTPQAPCDMLRASATSSPKETTCSE